MCVLQWGRHPAGKWHSERRNIWRKGSSAHIFIISGTKMQNNSTVFRTQSTFNVKPVHSHYIHASDVKLHVQPQLPYRGAIDRSVSTSLHQTACLTIYKQKLTQIHLWAIRKETNRLRGGVSSTHSLMTPPSGGSDHSWLNGPTSCFVLTFL